MKILLRLRLTFYVCTFFLCGCASIFDGGDKDEQDAASVVSLTDTINAMNLAALNGFMEICNDDELQNKTAIPFLYEMTLSYDSESVKTSDEGFDFVLSKKKTYSSTNKFDTTITFSVGVLGSLQTAIKNYSNNSEIKSIDWTKKEEVKSVSTLKRKNASNIHVDSLRKNIVANIKSILNAELNSGTKWQKLEAGIFVKFIDSGSQGISFKAFDQVDLTTEVSEKQSDTMSIKIKMDIEKTKGFKCPKVKGVS